MTSRALSSYLYLLKQGLQLAATLKELRDLSGKPYVLQKAEDKKESRQFVARCLWNAILGRSKLHTKR